MKNAKIVKKDKIKWLPNAITNTSMDSDVDSETDDRSNRLAAIQSWLFYSTMGIFFP